MPENTTTTEAPALRLVGQIRGEDVRTPYSDSEALALLTDNVAPSDNFARSLVEQYRDRSHLSPLQWAWVHRLAIRHQERQQAPNTGTPAQPPRFPRIAEMFRNAAGHLRQPRIAIQQDGVHITLSLAGANSRVPGSINVTDGRRYPMNTFYGRVHQDGRWEPSRLNPSEAVERLLDTIEANPSEAIGTAGRLAGSCCFCRRALTDERSLLVGYGPVCADHFHLPWGDRPAGQATVAAGEYGAARPAPARTPRARRTVGERLAALAGRTSAPARELHTEVCSCCGENKTPGVACTAC